MAYEVTEDELLLLDNDSYVVVYNRATTTIQLTFKKDSYVADFSEEEAIKVVGGLRAALYAHTLGKTLESIDSSISTPDVIATLMKAITEELENASVPD